MRDKTKTILYTWFTEVWNENKEISIDALMTEKGLAHGIVSPDMPPGPEGFKLFHKSFNDQFDQIKIDIKDVVSQDDMECALTDVTAIHRETGKPVSFSGLCMVRIEEGQIAEAWNHYDFLGLYTQLGQVLTPMTEV